MVLTHPDTFLPTSDDQGECPVNLPDPIWKHFSYGQLWPLQPVRHQNQAGLRVPDLTSHIHFSSVFPKKAWIMLCKADAYPIWVAWSGFGQTHAVSDRMQPAHYQFRNFQTQLCSSTHVPDLVVQNWPRSNLVLAGYQVLAKCIWSRSKLVCKNHLARFWLTLPSLSKSDPARLLGVFLQPRKPTDKARART